MQEYELFTPGPVRMHPDTVLALGCPLIPHYGDTWIADIYDPAQRALSMVFQTKNDVITFPSSGSGALESIFSSLGNEKHTLVVFRNGIFGDRLLEISRHYFSAVVDCSVQHGLPVTAEIVSAFLKRHPAVTVVAVVHGETSTGVVNDIEAIGSVVKEKERVYIVDAISTLGGMDVKVDAWEIDFCASASQKGISAAPGLSFVAVSEMGYAWLSPREKIHGWYHNLHVWRDAIAEWGAWHPYPVTLPVNLFYALHKALGQLLAEGLAGSFKRHQEIAGYFRRRIQEQGATLFCATPGAEMDTVTSFLLPEGQSALALRAYLKEEHSMIVAGGHAAHKDSMLRVGHMGYGAQTCFVDAVLGGISAYLKEAV